MSSTLPETWEDVLDLARRGFVTVSAFPIDMLMHSYTFCAALGHAPFQDAAGVAPDEVLAAALAELRKLVALCDPACLDRNPIRTAEWMSQTTDPRAAYCPFAYGYSNYSRPRYAPFLLKAGGLVTFQGKRLRSTLGGAGIAVSSKTKHPQACMDFAAIHRRSGNPERRLFPIRRPTRPPRRLDRRRGERRLPRLFPRHAANPRRVAAAPAVPRLHGFPGRRHAGRPWLREGRHHTCRRRRGNQPALPKIPNRHPSMKRFGSVTEVLPDKLAEYKHLHANAWPGVLRRITASNIRNYSIYFRTFDDGRHFLFTYFEYIGEDFDADMAAIAADEETLRWWDVCKPCLKPFAGLPPGECWAPMEEVFHSA